MYVYTHMYTHTYSWGGLNSPIKRQIGWEQWLMPVIPATQETEIKKPLVPGHPEKKISKTSISTKKLGMMTHTCNPRQKIQDTI
jgi:hypothetical protein